MRMYVAMLLMMLLVPAQHVTIKQAVNVGKNVVFVDIDGDGKLEQFVGDVRILHYRYRGVAYTSSSNIILNTSLGQYIVGIHSEPYDWDIYNYVIAAVNMTSYSRIPNDNWLVMYDFSGKTINYVYLGNSSTFNIIAVQDGGVFYNETTIVIMDTRRYAVYKSTAFNTTKLPAWRDGYRIYFYEYEFPGVLYKKYFYWSSVYTVWSVNLMRVIVNASIVATDVFGGMIAVWGKEVTGVYTLTLLQDRTIIATLTFEERIINVALGDLGDGGSADAIILTANHLYVYDKNKGVFINKTLEKPASNGLAVVDLDYDGQPEVVYTANDGTITYVKVQQGIANRFIDVPAYRVPQNFYRLYDYDHDSVSQGDEIVRYKTSILSPDTDGDGISDYDEINVYNTNPALNDTDGDGISDGQEIILKLDPLNPDTDGDGLQDGQEIQFGSDPTNPDTDDDGLNDYYEFTNGTNPRSADTDHDGLSDYDEITKYHTDPTNPDTDGDGFIDSKDPDPLKQTIIKAQEADQGQTVTAVILFTQVLASLVMSIKYGRR